MGGASAEYIMAKYKKLIVSVLQCLADEVSALGRGVPPSQESVSEPTRFSVPKHDYNSGSRRPFETLTGAICSIFQN